jgi:uncharacterized membrane protein (GlpM family)
MENQKHFWKSRTIVIAVIMLVLLFVNFFFPGILPLQQIEESLNQIFIASSDDQITNFNWGAFFSLLSMIALRFVTRKPVKRPISKDLFKPKENEK